RVTRWREASLVAVRARSRSGRHLGVVGAAGGAGGVGGGLDDGRRRVGGRGRAVQRGGRVGGDGGGDRRVGRHGLRGRRRVGRRRSRRVGGLGHGGADPGEQGSGGGDGGQLLPIALHGNLQGLSVAGRHLPSLLARIHAASRVPRRVSKRCGRNAAAALSR